MKRLIKTIICLLSGVVSVQQNFGKIIGWADIEPETADYYSCFLFRNGRHIPVPVMLSIYGITITHTQKDGERWKRAWFKLDLQEIIIFWLGKIMKLSRIRRLMDKMNQDLICEQMCIIE